MSEYVARAYRKSDDADLQAILDEQMSRDSTWPSPWVRDWGNIAQWLKEETDLGRWIAMDKNSTVLAHVGLQAIRGEADSEKWTNLLGYDSIRIGKIGKLIVHPDFRREGLSLLVTRCCVRQTVERGLIPVATAYKESKASIEMMTRVGWTIVGSNRTRRSKRLIVNLIPPQKLIDAALKVKAD